MGTLTQKAEYLYETSKMLKNTIKDLGVDVDDSTTFREYVTKLQEIEFYIEAHLDKDNPVPPSGGTRTLTINSNDSWEFTKPSWLEVAPTDNITDNIVSGKGKAELTLTFPLDYDREDYVNLTITTKHNKTVDVEIMVDNSPLIFETDGLAEEEYTVAGVTYKTKVDTTRYTHKFGLNDSKTVDLRNVNGLIKVLSTPNITLNNTNGVPRISNPKIEVFRTAKEFTVSNKSFIFNSYNGSANTLKEIWLLPTFFTNTTLSGSSAGLTFTNKTNLVKINSEDWDFTGCTNFSGFLRAVVQ